MSKLNYNQLAAEIHANSLRHGWWENSPSAEHFLTLVACELAEAVEADRKNKWANIPNPIPAGTWCSPQIFNIANVHFKENFKARIKDTVEDELADAAIRLLDIAGAYNWDFNHNPIAGTYANMVNPAYSFTENIGAIMFCVTNRGVTTYHRVACALVQIEWLADQLGIDLVWHIKHKMLYNASRPYKHGKAY